VIAGIGIDSTEIDRFRKWISLGQKKLEKIFSTQEIAYCLEHAEKSAERFAARFAAKEAFFKALSHIAPEHSVPFFFVCKQATVENTDNGNPQLLVQWKKLGITSEFKTFITLTHTNNTATAFVIIENID